MGLPLHRCGEIAGQGSATSIAFEVGYESPNQFSREYARQFGLPPSKDINRLRRGIQRDEPRP